MGVVLGLVVVGVLGWEPLYTWATTRILPWEGNLRGYEVRGYWRFVRGTSGPAVQHGPSSLWYVSTGFRFREVYFDNNLYVKGTRWNPDGTVAAQYDKDLGEKTSPPWLWGETDQTEPTAPWWKGGK